jgi:hypothetical protein
VSDLRPACCVVCGEFRPVDILVRKCEECLTHVAVSPEAVDEVPAPTIPAQTILEEAAEVTSGSRQRAYGHPRDNHGNTAALWGAYLTRKYGFEGDLTARDVCLMMVLLKVSRDANKPGRDNLVDMAGYARNAEMIDQ